MATYEYIDGNTADGAILGATDEAKIGFYGKVPVVQRPYSSAVHATAGIVTSSSFGATQLAAVQEIQKTLIGLGLWASS
jgi:hypothetical protein